MGLKDVYFQSAGSVNSIGYVLLSVVLHKQVTLIFVDKVPAMYAMARQGMSITAIDPNS